MAIIKPFHALLANRAAVAELSCPPYDVITVAEAREWAQAHPDSFVRIVRAEVDFPPDTDPYDRQVYTAARRNLEDFLARQLLHPTATETMLVYRMASGDHQQHGVVAVCAVDEYESGAICRHENTKPDKENDRTQHILAISAHPEPVILAFRDEEKIAAMVAAEASQSPLFDFTADDDVRHTLWEVREPQKLVDAFSNVGRFYIADGHHRCASAARAREQLRRKSPSHTGDEAYNFFPATLFPASQLRILPYNRIVQNLTSWDPKEFLAKLRSNFEVKEGTAGVPRRGHVRLYFDSKWYQIALIEPESAEPIDKLDVSKLHDQLLKPMFGITDQRTDSRLDFVGGLRSLALMQRAVDNGEAHLAISLHPTSMDELLAVSDAGRLMPPKSTWFEPKLRSGLFVHPIQNV